MQLLFTSQDRIFIYHLQNLLHQEGIDCMLKNEFLGSAASEVPFFECWLELWVQKKRQFKQAKMIVQEQQNLLVTAQQTPKKMWTCGECGEQHELQFSHCWQCETRGKLAKDTFNKYEQKFDA